MEETMALASWWPGDQLPTLAPLPGFRAAITADIEAFARLAGLDPAEVRARLGGGHRPYVAFIDGIPASYGWVAGAGEPLAPCWHCAIEAARRDLPPAAAACFSDVLDDRPCTCGAAA